MDKKYGIAVSPGVAIAKAIILDSSDIPVKRIEIQQAEIPREIARFEDALTKTRAELLSIRKKVATELGREHSEIFNAHLLILEDRTLIEEVISRLREEKVKVEWIFSEIATEYARAFNQINDDYLRERTADVKDISQRVIRNLLCKKKQTISDIVDKVVIISHDLSPTETAVMNKEFLVGFATDVGGPTSHTAILARSLEIPAVVGLRTISTEVLDGDTIIIDGNKGVVVINPTQEEIDAYKTEEERFEAFVVKLDELRDLPAVTTDGKQISLKANIEFPDEVESVITHGADGIGLYRTEYMYLKEEGFPSEEVQFNAYKQVASNMGGKPSVVRTLDLGGDKFISSLEVSQDLNTFMGWRAIRFCLSRVDIFKTQLRAILRASVFGNVQIMIPMISNIVEVRKAKEIINEVKDELKKKNVSFDDNIKICIMVEVPSAAITSDILAKEVDFFSIGSNDLIQYALAVERINEKIAYLYQPTHPAILRLIKETIRNAHKHNILVSVCGEMASNPLHAVLLVGLGIDELSLSSVLLPTVKKALRSVSFSQASAIAERCLTFCTNEEVQNYLDKELVSIVNNIDK